MSKPKVFVTRAIPEKGLDMVKEFCDADIWPGELPPPREVVLERVRGVDGILSLLTTKMDATVMDAAAGSSRSSAITQSVLTTLTFPKPPNEAFRWVTPPAC